ncbi:MAG TPA: LysR family transcriptional regulator [Paenalcaligenes sp.]|nr:LysR family transcriptional regulator [Paenalcaligenes sp.]
MLEIKHLETLTAIRAAGSLQEAAELLHVTQSALSHQLRELEARLGVSLLNRRTRPARLTTAALRIVALADDVLPRIRATEKELQSLAKGESGRLYLAIDCHSCFQWLMPALDTFRKKWPDISLDLSAAFSFAPLPALIRGDLDLVITSDPQELNGIEYTPLFRYELVAVLGSQHPLLELPFLKPEHFSAYTLITYPVSRERLDVFTQFLDHEGIEPAEIRQAELTPMIIQLVASHRGLTALPNWAVDEYLTAGWVQTRPLGAQGVWRTLYAAKRKEDMDARYVLDFIQQAQETCFEHLHGILPASSS